MQKITVKNFGPIEKIEDLQIKRVMVFIGQQATGKSTLSKLIYFFQTIEEEVANFILRGNIESSTDFLDYLINHLRNKFYEYFGLIAENNLEASFYYSTKKWIKLTSDNDGSINVKFSEEFKNYEVLNNNYLSAIKAYKESLNSEEKKYSERIKENFIKKLIEGESIEFLKSIVDNENTNWNFKGPEQSSELKSLRDSLMQVLKRGIFFIPSTRSVFSVVKNPFLEQFADSIFKRGNTSIEKSNFQNIEYFDIFIRKFTRRCASNRLTHFRSKSLKEIIQVFKIRRGIKEIPFSEQFLKQIEIILKGEYRFDESGEKIILNNNKSVQLNQASSGQQETLWIMLDLFIALLQGDPSHFTIEEPEAHLYPIGQRNIVNLFSLFLAANSKNQLLITTHSPYILTAFNNLLFAGKIAASKNGQTQEKLNAILDGANYLKIEEFGAYMLKDGKAISIFNNNTGMIDENELDDASDVIMDTFDELMEIYKG